MIGRKSAFNYPLWLLLGAMIGCSPAAKQEAPVETVAVTFRDQIIDNQTLIEKSALAGTAKLGREQIKILSLHKIDSAAASPGHAFEYRLLDTLFSAKSLKIVLLMRIYEEENIGWIAAYDGEHTLLDKVKVYVDNSEGFYSVTSTIKSNMVTITTEDEFSERPDGKKKVRTVIWSGDHFAEQTSETK